MRPPRDPATVAAEDASVLAEIRAAGPNGLRARHVVSVGYPRVTQSLTRLRIRGEVHPRGSAQRCRWYAGPGAPRPDAVRTSVVAMAAEIATIEAEIATCRARIPVLAARARRIRAAMRVVERLVRPT